MDEEIYRLILKIGLYIKVLIFNITGTSNNDVVLELPWLKRVNALLYYAHRQLILLGIKELI